MNSPMKTDASTPSSSPPFLSIVIPVRNEAAHIEAVLEAILAQDYPADRVEILVIDGRSTDKTRERVAAYAAVHTNIMLYDNPKRLSSAARNIGIDHFRSDIYLLVDGHCLIDNPQMLSAVAGAFDDETIDCLGRPQPLEMHGANRMQHAIAAARRSPLGHHPDSFIYADQPCIAPAISIAVAYRRRVFETVGRFDEHFDAAEDCEFNHRCDKVGLRCLFTPAAAVRYVPRSRLSGMFRQLVRYGRGRARLARKHPETFSLKSTIPAFFLIGLVVGLIAAICWPGLRLYYIGGLAVYLLCLIAESLRLAFLMRRPSFVALLPVVLMTIHVAAGVGLLRETLWPDRQDRFTP